MNFILNIQTSDRPLNLFYITNKKQSKKFLNFILWNNLQFFSPEIYKIYFFYFHPNCQSRLYQFVNNL